MYFDKILFLKTILLSFDVLSSIFDTLAHKIKRSKKKFISLRKSFLKFVYEKYKVMYVLPRNLLITYIPKHSSRLIIHFTLLVWIQLKRKRDNKNENMNTLTAANMLCTFVNQRQQVLCLVHNWIMNQGQDQGLQKEKWLTPLNVSSVYELILRLLYVLVPEQARRSKFKIKLSDYIK